jgi:hypothetical protein
MSQLMTSYTGGTTSKELSLYFLKQCLTRMLRHFHDSKRRSRRSRIEFYAGWFRDTSARAY